jgi:ankyrin repeat domain-containing protein 50
MDSLVGKHNVTAVRKALDNLPQEVDHTYDEAMDRIKRQNKDDQELARRILSWLSYACRSLQVDELQHALAVMPEMTSMDPDSVIDEEILTSLCAGLVVVDEERSIIRLVRKRPASGPADALLIDNRLHCSRVF